VQALFTIFVMGGTITDIAKATGILEPKGGAGPPPTQLKTLDDDSIFGRFDKLHLRPFLTSHHAGIDADVDAGYFVESAIVVPSAPPASVIRSRASIISWMIKRSKRANGTSGSRFSVRRLLRLDRGRK
jgi:hypothetical protein